MAAVAALAARSTWDPPALVLAITIVAMPALVLLAAVWPAAALGVFVVGQVLEAFEYPTAVGTVSFGVILLGLLLLFHWRYVLDTIRRDRDLVVASVLFGGWIATYAFRLRYEPASSVAREVVTVLGFGAFAAVGIAVARCRHVVRNVGIGATAALIILGVCGVLASVGAIPAPDRIGGQARDFLWFSNPIKRNYGLNVAFDSVALLVPLSVSWLLVSLASRRGRGRIAAAGVLTALLLLMVFVFQAREMIVQLAVAVLATVCVVRPKVGWIVATAALPIVAAGVIHLVALDKTSSDVRLVPDRYAFTVLAHDPQRFLLGTSESGFFNESIRSSPALVAATQTGTYSVHNFFLANLVAGGIGAFTFTVLLFGVIFRRAWRLWRLAPSDSDSRALLVACVVVLVTLLMETVQQNAAGYWILAGLVLGFPLNRGDGAEEEQRSWPGASYIPPQAPASAWLGVAIRVSSAARRHRIAVALPLLLVPTIALALALSNAPTRTAAGHVAFTELPLEQQYFGNPPLILRTDDVRSGRVSLIVDSRGSTTSVTVRATADRPRDAAARVNAYLGAYVPWHERVASARLTAAIERLRARIASLRAPRNAEKRRVLASRLDQMVRLSDLPIGRPSTLDRVDLPPQGWSIVAVFAIALGLGLFLGLGAAVAADALSVRYGGIGDPVTPDSSVAATGRTAA